MSSLERLHARFAVLIYWLCLAVIPVAGWLISHTAGLIATGVLIGATFQELVDASRRRVSK